jgi:trigger factor
LEPVVDLGDYLSLREDWEAPSVTDEEVDQVLEQLREENAILEPVDRAAEMGDQVLIDVKASVDDDTIVDEEGIEVILSEERPFLSQEFVAALVGLSADEESVFTLALPETIEETQLRGADAEFTVRVDTVHARELPELNDALASTVGSFETFDALRQDVVDRILAQKSQMAESEYRDKLVEKLVAQAELTYPPQMVEDTLDDMVHETEHRVERQSHMSFEDALRLEGRTVDQFRDEVRPQAEERVARSLVLHQFAQQESVAVDDDEVVSEYATFMSQFGPDVSISSEDMDLDSALAQNFRNNILGRKVMDRLTAIGRGQADLDVAAVAADESVEVAAPVAEDNSADAGASEAAEDASGEESDA